MPDGSTSGREPQLDGLRCLAFLAVFMHHADEPRFPWGWGGVQFFFALSGFLITRILVRGFSGQVGPDLRRYYVRRTLRIFPLYYAIIALVAINGFVPHLGWFLTFTYNVRGFLDLSLDQNLSHFWTLCVEEQFYLLYPLALLITPSRWRINLIVGLITAAIGFQVYAEFHFNVRAARILLPYCGEDLLWGSLAGLVDLRSRPRRHEGAVSFLAGLPIVLLGWNLHEERLPLPVGFQDLASVSLYGVGNALIVFGASRTKARWIIGPLALAPLAYLGRISYGLYAFHLPVLRGWINQVPFAFLIPRPWGALAMTIALAALSWRYFEGPINRLKNRFDRLQGLR